MLSDRCALLDVAMATGIRKLEMLFGFFIGVMLVSFGWMFSQVGINPSEITHGILVPTLNTLNIHQVWQPFKSPVFVDMISVVSSVVRVRICRSVYMSTNMLLSALLL